MKVGIIGCGNIADIYFSNSQKYFNNFQIVACADIKNEAAKNYAEKYGVEQLSVDQILSNKEIELIINLTIPDVHFEVSKSILEAGKHSYSEKPLSIKFEHGEELVTVGNSNGVPVGCAPDPFLGSGDRQGQEIEVEIPTTLVSQIEFQNGALIDSFFSFDVWKHSKNHIELYGDKGSINIPDPNMFGGDILVCKSKNGPWENIDTKNNNLGKINIKNKSEKANESAGIANYRGIGVSETVDAIKNNRLNRCSGELSLHVLDILDSIIKSSKENTKIELRSSIKNLNYFSEDEISNLLK